MEFHIRPVLAVPQHVQIINLFGLVGIREGVVDGVYGDYIPLFPANH